ncbi:SDR family NAD(P)-dependent oxidoreductase [Pedobacter sp.]|uniref:SDR family NAD(P)-dependent oxidoreductase n=1 Tax=Pedobacter sp. TaxID=1411316 RepID=UPI003BACD975
MMKRFENKVALITGSSQGIGAACARRLASEGCRIILNGHTLDDRGNALIAEIADLGSEAVFLEADLSRADQAIGLVERSIQAFGGLDILINNAGIEKHADFWEVSEEDYDAVMNTNLKGVFFAIQSFVKYCRQKDLPGVVINMSSVHEEIAFPHFAAYCASKGGLKMLTRNLASELAPLSIRINNVAPGAISTPINQELMSDKEQLGRVLKNIPMGRMGTSDEVAGVVAFLASEDSAYITGSTYYIDGGLTYHYQEQ